SSHRRPLPPLRQRPPRSPPLPYTTLFRSPGGLAEQQRQPAPRGAAGDALDEPARDEQDRGHEADAPGRGQAADEEGEDSHAQQGDDHHGLAADLVSEVAGDEPADRPRDETGGEGRER